MTFREFDEAICKHLPYGSTCQYGDIGTGYLQVLVPHKNQIICVGEFIYRFWREGLHQHYPDLVSRFAVECGDFFSQLTPSQKNYSHLRENLDVPTICYDDNKLVILHPKTTQPQP